MDQRGLVIHEHRITVPLDHDHPGDGPGETLEVFARVVAAPDGGDRPYLLFLQGGPGQEAPRPVHDPATPGWLPRALADYRVVMLDQRGTGLSTPYGGPGPDPAADAARLTHLRADSIVRDAECLREHLGAERWSVLGQSFGGFCVLHYLSTAAGSLTEAFVTGGLSPVGRRPEDVYAATWEVQLALDARYHRQFPGDRDRLARLLDRCDAGEVLTPAGHPVSRRLMRTVGNALGMDGGAEKVHHLLERDHRSPAFRHDLAAAFPFQARNPLYALVHESSYADGHPTSWAAHRTAPAEATTPDSLVLSGEHLFPWHFTDDAALAPWREVADLLADHPWPRLYDADALRTADVPVAAAVYADDPFVVRGFSEETAALLPRGRTWLTNEYLHNGLRDPRVLDRLIDLTRGRA